MVLSDISGNNIFTFESKADGSYVAVGDSEQKINYSFTNETINSHFVFDLDKRKAKIVKDGKDIGTFDMSESATDISRLSFVTGKDEQTTPLMETVTFSAQAGNEYQNSQAEIFVYAQAVQVKNNGTTALDVTGWPAVPGEE